MRGKRDCPQPLQDAHAPPRLGGARELKAVGTEWVAQLGHRQPVRSPPEEGTGRQGMRREAVEHATFPGGAHEPDPAERYISHDNLFSKGAAAVVGSQQWATEGRGK